MTKEIIIAPNKVDFLSYLHSFRGLAILKIVFGHAIVAACITTYGKFDVSNPLLMIGEVFYHDSTLYFAIISGLLFSKVLKPKGYLKFYKGKLKNIILPYIFFTFVFTFIKFKFNNFSIFYESFIAYLINVWINLIYGKANFVLWYIPVLIFLYLVTPVLDFLQHKNKYSKLLFYLIILLPLVVSRIQMLTGFEIKIETMVYFMGSYAFGMFLGSNIESNISAFERYKTLLYSIAILTTVLLFYFYIHQIDYVGSVSLKESFFYIQKTVFALIFLIFFKTRHANQPLWLSRFAQNSFAIYFIHGSLVYVFAPLFMVVFFANTSTLLHVLLGAILLFVLVLITCELIVLVFKKLFGKQSKMLIGV